MDDQALIRTYGNTDLPEGTPDRPLVTFALFAYNQEKYIREAVEGAFSQTYTPLEIILSDDCSSDGTFEIIEEMAQEYRGPHLVKVRRNRQNLGLIEHVNLVIPFANSDLIVLAAGDDISLPLRTTKIVKIFVNDHDACLVHSKVREICKDGKWGELITPPIQNGENLLLLATAASIYIGASAAINRSIYRTFGPILEKGTYEDLVFGFRAALLRGLRYIDEELVLYRANVGISSQGRRGTEPKRQQRLRQIGTRLSTLKQRHNDLLKVSSRLDDEVGAAISKEIDIASARLLYWIDSPRFLKEFLMRPRLCHLKAISSETKYLLGTIK